MAKCVKCDIHLDFFSPRHRTKDGVVCLECFEKIKAESNRIKEENNKITKDYIKKYLSNKDADFRSSIKDIFNRQVEIGIETDSLAKAVNNFRDWRLNIEANRAGLDIDTIFCLKRNCENSLLFFNDLEKLKKIFHNKGIEADYLEILTLFSECIDEGYIEAVGEVAENTYKVIVSLSGENLSKEDVVRLTKLTLQKNNYSLESIVEIILRLFLKFKLEGDEQEVKDLISKVEEEDSLADFEEELSSPRGERIGDFSTLSGREFEVYIKNLFELLNYTVIRTKLSGDQGADLILSKNNEKIAVQIKKYNEDVSNKAIQEVVAAKTYYRSDRGMVVTNSSFTKGAVELALANQVELWDGKKLELIVNDLNKNKTKGPEEGLNYAEEGVQLVNDGNYDGAISKLNKALKLYPNLAFSYCYRGLAYLRKGEFDKAITDSNKAIEIQPSFSLSFLIRGDAFAAKGEHVKATQDFTTGIEKNDSAQEVYQFYAKRGEVYLAQGENDKAVVDFNKVIEDKPDLAVIYHNRALCFYAKKEYDKAWKDVRKAEELGLAGNPKFIENLKKASGRMK